MGMFIFLKRVRGNGGLNRHWQRAKEPERICNCSGKLFMQPRAVQRNTFDWRWTIRWSRLVQPSGQRNMMDEQFMPCTGTCPAGPKVQVVCERLSQSFTGENLQYSLYAFLSAGAWYTDDFGKRVWEGPRVSGTTLTESGPYLTACSYLTVTNGQYKWKAKFW